MYSNRRFIHRSYFLALYIVFADLAALSLPAPRIVDLTAADGTILKVTFFASDKPGPAVLLCTSVMHNANSGTFSANEWRHPGSAC